MLNIKKLLGLQTKVGVEALKEKVENDIVNTQITALEIQIASQIEDNNEDITEIVELIEELTELQLTLERRNDRYEDLLEVLG